MVEMRKLINQLQIIVDKLEKTKDKIVIKTAVWLVSDQHLTAINHDHYQTLQLNRIHPYNLSYGRFFHFHRKSTYLTCRECVIMLLFSAFKLYKKMYVITV